jgi:predicted enzyme related to lactoylglutathione lyase
MTPSRSRPAFVIRGSRVAGLVGGLAAFVFLADGVRIELLGGTRASTAARGRRRSLGEGRERGPSALPALGGALELVHASSAVTFAARRVSLGVVTTTTGGTAVLEKVFYTSVLVGDQDEALDFYTNVLGLEKRVENPTPDGSRFLTVGVKGDDFQLVLWPGTPGQAEPAMGRPPASVTIETDDCRNTLEELKSRGVEFVSDVLEFPWGYVAQFQDPDGNRLQLREGR